MQVQRFDPFTVLARMDREFDELVRRGWSPRGDKASGEVPMAGFVPAVELVREGSDVVVRVELPGIDVDRDVSIEVDRGKLIISGERRDERADSTDGVLVRELRYGQFRREFALPPGVSPEQVEANYDAGLLDVRVRNVVQPEPPTVRVPITTTRGAAEPRVVEAAQQGETTQQPA